MSENLDIIFGGLQHSPEDSAPDDVLLSFISEKVSWYLENDPDLLMSYLYRLDVAESKINEALSFEAKEEPFLGIARLILKRQKQRWLSKKTYKVDPIEGWEF